MTRLPTNLSPLSRMAVLTLLLLLASTAIIAALRVIRPGRYVAELSARLRSWWIMATVFFSAVALSNGISLVFFGFLSFWALKEYVTLLDTRPEDHSALVLYFLTIPLQYYWAAIGWYGMFTVFIPVCIFLLVPAQLALAQGTAGFLASTSQLQWGAMAFVFSLSHLAFLLQLPPISTNPQVNGRSLVLFLVFVVETSDVLQYVWGKTLGRHKVLPVVSPNKTWEGLIGGIVSTTLLSLLIRFLTPFTVPETLLVSMLITVAGFCGGAVMSALKRDFNVKDFGALIPGHGGMLDRVDSLCYAAPLFLLYVRAFHY